MPLTHAPLGKSTFDNAALAILNEVTPTNFHLSSASLVGGGIAGLLVWGPILGGGITSTAIAPVAGAVLAVVGVGALATAGAVEATHYFLGDKSPGAEHALDQMRAVRNMDLYSCQIQSHYLSVHPDRPTPHTPQEVAEALRDPAVFKEVRQAAAKDAPVSVISALDKFASEEQQRQTAIAEHDKTQAPDLARQANQPLSALKAETAPAKSK